MKESSRETQAPSQAQCLLALPALRILAISFSFYVWHTGHKERIHSRPAKEIDFSNVAINLRKKIFGADFGFVKKKLNSLATFWFALTENKKKDQKT